MVTAITQAITTWHGLPNQDTPTQQDCLTTLATSIARQDFPKMEVECMALAAWAKADYAAEPTTPLLGGLPAKRRRRE